MFDAGKNTYKSYAGDSEWHRLRLTSMVIISIVIAVYVSDISKTVLQVISLILSVLAGFSFTALFSSHTLTTLDLPRVKDESDRADIRRLKLLGKNFRIRTKFFMSLAVIDLLVIFILSVNFDFSGNIIDNLKIFLDLYIDKFHLFFNYSKLLLLSLLKFSVVFVFMECLYTFYRLSETILAVLDIRGEYLDAHEEK